MSMLEQLTSWGATHAELADWLHISKRTFEYWLADEKTTYVVKSPALLKDAPPVIEKLTLRAILERGAAHMRLSIRRYQMKLLEAGSNTMAVWLGKQYLGQTDRMRFAEVAPEALGATLDVPVTLEELLRDYRKASK